MAQSAPAKKVSQSETGHAKNVANIGAMASYLESLGSPYNPTVAALTVAGLKTIKGQGDAALAKVDAMEMPYRNAVNRRQEAFDGMSKLSTRVLGALTVVGAPREITDAKTIIRKIRGSGKKLKTDDPDAKTASTSQLSFDSRVDNFKQLIAFITGIPAYKPNEAALQVASLTGYANPLPALSDTINKTSAAFTNARNERNKLLYDANAGILALAKKAKAYVRSVYGASSKEYKKVAGIEFRPGRK